MRGASKCYLQNIDFHENWSLSMSTSHFFAYLYFAKSITPLGFWAPHFCLVITVLLFGQSLLKKVDEITPNNLSQLSQKKYHFTGYTKINLTFSMIHVGFIWKHFFFFFFLTCSRSLLHVSKFMIISIEKAIMCNVAEVISLCLSFRWKLGFFMQMYWKLHLDKYSKINIFTVISLDNITREKTDKLFINAT